MFALIKRHCFLFKIFFEWFKVSKKFKDSQFPENEPFSTIKMAKVKIFEMCTGIGNYCFPSNFETKQDNAKIPSDSNSRKSDIYIYIYIYFSGSI